MLKPDRRSKKPRKPATSMTVTSNIELLSAYTADDAQADDERQQGRENQGHRRGER